jgi:hypothetical protein
LRWRISSGLIGGEANWEEVLGLGAWVLKKTAIDNYELIITNY